MQPLHIIIFRNNLRVHDNAALYYASQTGELSLGLYPLSHLNHDNPFQKEFTAQSLLELAERLQQFGLNLYWVSDLQATLSSLAKHFRLIVHYQRECGWNEKQMEKQFTGFEHHAYEDKTLLRPFSFSYHKSFSHFRKKAEQRLPEEPLGLPQPMKSITLKKEPLPCTFSPLLIPPGEHAALARLNAYLPHIHNYYATRSLVDGEMSSTRFSPYLSIGALSPRTVYAAIKQEEQTTHASKSSYWIIFELLWRDFFFGVMDQSGTALFHAEGLKGVRYDYRQKDESHERFFRAKSGVGLIDAAMMELLATGWMSNRNRQLVVSYFIKNLGFSWLEIARFFERHLIDYDVASNYGNCAYQGYVGNDSTYRIFDIEDQANRYGAEAYVHQWLGQQQTFNLNLTAMAETVKKEIYKL